MEQRTILLIDDDPVINFIHRTIISSVFPENRIITVENGQLALELIKEEPDRPYLVFLDINMPVMNGWEFLDAIRSQGGSLDLSIHILTSSVDSRDIERSSSDELVVSYLAKPLSRSGLLALRSRL